MNVTLTLNQVDDYNVFIKIKNDFKEINVLLSSVYTTQNIGYKYVMTPGNWLGRFKKLTIKKFFGSSLVV